MSLSKNYVAYLLKSEKKDLLKKDSMSNFSPVTLLML